MPTFLNRAMKGNVLTSQEADDLFSPQYTQATHGLIIGDIVRMDPLPSITHVKALADSMANIGIGLGIVVHVPNVNTLSIIRWGNHHEIDVPGHGIGLPTKPIVLSQTVAGVMTAVIPPTGLIVNLGHVIDVDTIMWAPGLFVNEI